MSKRVLTNAPVDSDYFETPIEEFNRLDEEFGFDLDACANADNTLCDAYISERDDALKVRWSTRGRVIWCNPPYSKAGMKDAFIAKAREAQRDGCTVVLCVPAKVNTVAFHQHVWNLKKHRPRRGVELRFPKGRWRFCRDGRPTGGGRNEVMLVVFRPLNEERS